MRGGGGVFVGARIFYIVCIFGAEMFFLGLTQAEILLYARPLNLCMHIECNICVLQSTLDLWILHKNTELVRVHVHVFSACIIAHRLMIVSSHYSHSFYVCTLSVTFACYSQLLTYGYYIETTILVRVHAFSANITLIEWSVFPLTPPIVFMYAHWV